MTASDAVLWDIEKDPVLRSTITAVAVMDRSPDWDRFVARLDRASRLIPRLRQRVIVPPLRVGPPRWVVDPSFDLSYHVRRVRAPEPADLRAVLDLAQPLSMEAFDRARPLWEFTLVEGLTDGRAALVQKLHHSLTDGVGGIELALMMLDEAREVDDDGPLPSPPPPDPSSAPAVFAQAAAETGSELARRAFALPGAMLRTTTALGRRPLDGVGRAREVSGSIARLMTPVSEPASPTMRGRSLARRFDTLEVGLRDLKDAAHAAGGTLNDAFLAAVVGGVTRYHVAHGATLEQLRITMPINVRRAGDTMGGNRFAPARFAVPADVSDPAQRIRRLGELAHQWQEEPALAYTEAIASVLDRLPVSVTTGVFGGMLKNIDLVCTNVPGVPYPTYLAGAELERQYAFAPPSGAAVSVALLSHVGHACIGVVVDTAAVPDDDLFLRSLVAGFDEVLGLAGHQAQRTS